MPGISFGSFTKHSKTDVYKQNYDKRLPYLSNDGAGIIVSLVMKFAFKGNGTTGYSKDIIKGIHNSNSVEEIVFDVQDY